MPRGHNTISHVDENVVHIIASTLTERAQVTVRDIAAEAGIEDELALTYLDYLRKKRLAHRVNPLAQDELGKSIWAIGPGHNNRMGELPINPIQVTTRHWPRGFMVKASELERLLFPSYGVTA